MRRRRRLLFAGAAVGALALTGASIGVSGASTTTDVSTTTTIAAPSTTTVLPPTTTTTTTATTTLPPTTTTPPPTTTAVTAPSTSAPAPGPEPPFVEFAARADCYFGYPVVRIDATALHETSGGGFNLYHGEVPSRQGDVPALAAGESWSVLLPAGAYETVLLEVYFYGQPDLHPVDPSNTGLTPVDDRWVEIEMAACPLPPTAPTFTATVTGCVGGDDGAAIEVAVTNPPGGPERGIDIFYLFPLGVVEDYPETLVSVSVGDGEQVVEVIDEIAGVGVPLVAGDYAVRLAWQVDIPGDFPQLVQTEPIEVTVPACESSPLSTTEVRVASFNASLTRPTEGELVADLSTPDDVQAAAVAEIIQRTRPDVVLLGGFDLDADNEAVQLFQANYLAVPQHDAEPIDYPYWFTAEVNSGEQSGFDLDRDGTVGDPGDAFGFGEFPGQNGMAMLSRYPIVTDEVRTFQNLLWTSMPDARLPDDPATADPAAWYSALELAVLPWSSTSHWDVPIDIDGTTLHVLASQPTQPSDDNDALRNADEIRFWADYVDNDDTSWIVDDAGVTGGLDPDAEFVIVGDLNADPVDGDSVEGAIQQLLDLEVVQDPLPSSDGAVEAAEQQAVANATHEGDPALDTADFAGDPAPGNLRTDYVLPSDGFDVVDTGVFWPPSDDELADLVSTDPIASSDHRLVWVDLITGAEPPATTTAPVTTSVAPTTTGSSTPAGYGFEDFFDVSQLGNEAVRGTGCGGDGSIGDVIPDGWWRGFVRSWDGTTLEQSSSLQFDLICIYLEPVGDNQYVDGWVVNNNDRTRTVPIAPGFFVHGTTFVSEVSAPFDQPDVPFAPAAQAWIRIIDGTAAWAVSAPTG